MKKIPTAFEFWITRKGTEDGDIVEDLKEFARLHVAVALETAAANASVEGCNCNHPNYCTGECKHVDAKSILNAYPPENIK